MDPENFATLTLVLAGLLSIAFLVFLILGFKTWRVYTIILVLFNFCAAAGFFYYSVRTLQTHKRWRELVQSYQADVKDLDGQIKVLEQGATDEEGELTTAGIRQYKKWLDYTILDRGRTWTDCRLTAVVDPAVGSVKVAVPTGIDLILPLDEQAGTGTVLYAFQQKNIHEGGRFIGEFKVVARDIEAEIPTIDLAPMSVLTPYELERTIKANPEVLWVLYKIMPQDNHWAFTKISEDGTNPLDRMDADELGQLLPSDRVSEYNRDLQEAGPDDPDTRKWAKVVFKAPHKFATIDSHRILPVSNAGETSFDPGDEAIIDWFTYEELNSEEKVRLVSEVYVRKLRDYGFHFHAFGRARNAHTIAMIDVRDTTVFVDGSLTRSKVRDTSRTAERDNFRRDLIGFKAEEAAVANYRALLSKHLADVLAELKRVHFKNQELVAKLGAAQAQKKREIEANLVPSTPPVTPAPQPGL
jgi:hypothetical protein